VLHPNNTDEQALQRRTTLADTTLAHHLIWNGCDNDNRKQMLGKVIGSY
jgi:hypothetical protein